MRIHQNIVIGSKDYGRVNSRKNSNFYNEGKWRNYIEPLLPPDCKEMTFVEIGCNAGLFLKLAKKKGFKNVIGVEKDERIAKVAAEYVGDDATVVHGAIDRNIYLDGQCSLLY